MNIVCLYISTLNLIFIVKNETAEDIVTKIRFYNLSS